MSQVVFRYSPGVGRWEPVASLAMARRSHACVSLCGGLYVVGGVGARFLRLASVERLNLAAGVWQSVTPLNTARYRHSACAVGGRLFVVGGWDAGDALLASVEIYNPSADAWTAGPPLPTPTTNLGLCSVDTALYAVGGYTGGQSNAVYKFDLLSSRWTTVRSLSRGLFTLSVATTAAGSWTGWNGTTQALTDGRQWPRCPPPVSEPPPMCWARGCTWPEALIANTIVFLLWKRTTQPRIPGAVWLAYLLRWVMYLDARL